MAGQKPSKPELVVRIDFGVSGTVLAWAKPADNRVHSISSSRTRADFKVYPYFKGFFENVQSIESDSCLATLQLGAQMQDRDSRRLFVTLDLVVTQTIGPISSSMRPRPS